MEKVLGHKHVDSKVYVIVGSIVVLLLTIGIGIGFYIATEMVLILIISIILGIILSLIPIFVSKEQQHKKENVIILDESNKTLKVLSGQTYYKISLSSIDKIKVDNTTVVSTGKAAIPVKNSYGKLIFVYYENGSKHKIKSNCIEYVQSVATKIESMIITKV